MNIHARQLDCDKYQRWNGKVYGQDFKPGDYLIEETQKVLECQAFEDMYRRVSDSNWHGEAEYEPYNSKEERRKIARAVAEQDAHNYLEGESGREKMLPFSFVRNRILENIGQALYDAGFTWDGLSYEIRKEYAIEALRRVGYPE